MPAYEGYEPERRYTGVETLYPTTDTWASKDGSVWKTILSLEYQSEDTQLWPSRASIKFPRGRCQKNSLGIRVKNLGASYGGPLTDVFYLERYGKAPNTKHALMVFFEGNDLGDLEREAQALERFTASGEREYRIIRKEPSFLKMLLSWLLPRDRNTKLPFPFPPPGDKTDSGENALFTSTTGEVPVAVHYTPPGKEQITARTQALLTSALAKWARAAQTRGMKPWVVYMPCNLRVLHSHLQFLKNATKSVREWNPTDLPDFVRELSLLNGIAFIDVTPALVRETEVGRLIFNPVGDNHLNREGALLVAEVIAQALKATPAD